MKAISSVLQLKPKLTRNFLKEGYMEKTGPRVGGSMLYNEAVFLVSAIGKWVVKKRQ